MVKKSLYRQGDVLFIPIKSIDQNAVKRNDKIVARGEITGHMHQFQIQAHVDLFQNGSQQYAEIYEPSIISHEEHLPIEIPAGKYEIRIGRELDLMQQLRQVQD